MSDPTTDEFTLALADLRLSMTLLEREAPELGISAIVDRLSALARDNPSDLVLQAVRVTAAAVERAAAAKTPDARGQVANCLELLRLLAARPPALVRGWS